MVVTVRRVGSFVFGVLIIAIIVCGQTNSAKAEAVASSFDITEMSDMSGFDPTNITPPEGDTIKIGLIEPFSGPAAAVGEIYSLVLNWVAYDLNQRGGLLVDGKKKKIEIIKGDSQSKPAYAKLVTERLCLEEKVDILWGTAGTPIANAVQIAANKYKKIFMNCQCDDLRDAKHFSRYTFRTGLNTTMFGDAIAYFYSKRPEKKFYIICQDYSYGHRIADAFKAGLKKYKPDAVIVGEAYHPLFQKDFAPYITKIQGSQCDVVFTGDWLPDAGNLIRAARRGGLNVPFANLYADDPLLMKALGSSAEGMVNANDHMITVETKENQEFSRIWNEQWKHWKSPYNTLFYKWPTSVIGGTINQSYWLFDVIKRARSTDAEKIIEVWEGDVYRSFTGIAKMRAVDHQTERKMFVTEFKSPNKWFDFPSYGKAFVVPAAMCAPPIPGGLESRN